MTNRLLSLFLIVLILNSTTCYCQPEQKTQVEQRLKSDEKVSNLELKNEQQQKDIDRIEKSLSQNIKDSKEASDKSLADTKSLLNTYGGLLLLFLTFCGFIINFIGKAAIKKRVEELISETAQNHTENKIVETLNSTLTIELIQEVVKQRSEEEITKIIQSLEQKGNTTINEIKTKGEEAIKRIAPPKSSQELEKTSTDIEILRNNNKKIADEYFNIAYESKSPKIQIELYNKVLELDPDNVDAYNNIGVAYTNSDKPLKALDALNQAISRDSNYLLAIANRAQAYNLLNDYDQALSDIDKAIKLDPKYEYPYSVKGNVLTKMNQLAEAEVALNQAIKMNSNSAEAHFNLAYFYEERNEFEKSLENYLIAEKLDLTNKAMLYNNMAVLFRRQKKFDDAISYLEKARQHNPEFGNIDGTLALIYSDKDDDAKFYKYLQIALEKGCFVWNYLSDYAFDKYRDTEKFKLLIETYKKKTLE